MIQKHVSTVFNMRIGKVIGTVTLSRSHPSLMGACYRIAIPLSLDDLNDKGRVPAEELVVYDELGASLGSQIAFSEGGEAAQPFYPNMKPIDAYNAALLDQVEITPPA
jgi:microcompartment protein CcmK/EutM